MSERDNTQAAVPAQNPPDPDNPITAYWNKPVSDLATVAAGAFTKEDKERHTVYALATMAIVYSYWNGNKYGQEGNYPWRIGQRRSNGTYSGDRLGDRYLGHNIACIAVDGDGEIIDFDFNHNEIYSSSIEHAEARLVRRIFNLTQIYDAWQSALPPSVSGYGTMLNDVTIYTSLESCAQCSGIMTLGNVDKVIFLQSDPGQYLIGNILFNVTTAASAATAAGKYGAPQPIDATNLDFSYKQRLDDAFFDFRKQMRADPKNKFFYQADPKSKPITNPSITSFLCTDAAKTIFQSASDDFAALVLSYPNYVPPAGASRQNCKSNAQALEHAQRFVRYVAGAGRRGSPHK